MGSFVFKAGNSSSEQGGGQAGGENYGVLVSMINQDFFIIPSLGSFKIANVAAFLRAARRSRRCDLTRREVGALYKGAKFPCFKGKSEAALNAAGEASLTRNARL